MQYSLGHPLSATTLWGRYVRSVGNIACYLRHQKQENSTRMTNVWRQVKQRKLYSRYPTACPELLHLHHAHPAWTGHVTFFTVIPGRTLLKNVKMWPLSTGNWPQQGFSTYVRLFIENKLCFLMFDMIGMNERSGLEYSHNQIKHVKTSHLTKFSACQCNVAIKMTNAFSEKHFYHCDTIISCFQNEHSQSRVTRSIFRLHFNAVAFFSTTHSYKRSEHYYVL